MLPINKTHLAILRVLNEEEGKIIGSREIARRLKLYGVDISERTVRYHLRILDEKGLTKVFGREGRMITEKGKEELNNSFVSEKAGFIISKIDALSYMTSLDLENMTGQVVLNISLFPKRHFRDALRAMKPVFSSDYVMSDRVAVFNEGEVVGDTVVPEGYVGFGTVCSVTINGILLKEGIPVHSRFGGVLEIEGGQPIRFVSLISYEGSSLDPLEIFIRGKMTSVRQAVRKKEGRVLASFREIPVVCHGRVKELSDYLRTRGIKGILAIGQPNKELFEVPVGLDRAGVVVVGGLNPVAAVEEEGIPTESKAMNCLYEYSELKNFEEIYRHYKSIN